jgi:hypothetical protein
MCACTLIKAASKRQELAQLRQQSVIRMHALEPQATLSQLPVFQQPTPYSTVVPLEQEQAVHRF